MYVYLNGDCAPQWLINIVMFEVVDKQGSDRRSWFKLAGTQYARAYETASQWFADHGERWRHNQVTSLISATMPVSCTIYSQDTGYYCLLTEKFVRIILDDNFNFCLVSPKLKYIKTCL